MQIHLTEARLKDLEEVLTYIFEHEAEDYAERLPDTFPEEAEYIEECVREDNWESLDKFAWNGTKDIPHIYAPAVRVWRALKGQEIV